MQLHKRFTADQVKALLQGYCQGVMERQAVMDILGIGKTRFFALLEEYRQDPEHFSLVYERTSPKRLTRRVERAIEKQLREEKGLIDDPELPITTYNYSALRDRLREQGVKVALSTLIERAKEKDYYQDRPRRATHDREVLTSSIGALIQHDASHHRWSPYTKERWVLITSLDDFSRRLLYADFHEQESTSGAYPCCRDRHAPLWHSPAVLCRFPARFPLCSGKGQLLEKTGAPDRRGRSPMAAGNARIGC